MDTGIAALSRAPQRLLLGLQACSLHMLLGMQPRERDYLLGLSNMEQALVLTWVKRVSGWHFLNGNLCVSLCVSNWISMHVSIVLAHAVEPCMRCGDGGLCTSPVHANPKMKYK